MMRLREGDTWKLKCFDGNRITAQILSIGPDNGPWTEVTVKCNAPDYNDPKKGTRILYFDALRKAVIQT